MPQFAYKARKRTGEVVTGVLEVADRSAALLQIDRLGLFPVTVDMPKGAAAAAAAADKASAGRFNADFLPPALRKVVQRKRKPKLQELATFTTQLANLLKAGMPLTVALNSMSSLGSKGISPDVAKQLKQDVMEGRGLSDAMSKQPAIFSDLYINMVRAGEQSGALEDVLRRMADHFTRFAEVQAKFKSALIYPMFVMLVGIAIAAFFMTVMLPNFLKLFEGFKVPLPLATRMLIAISNAIKHWWWLMLAIIATVSMLFYRFSASEHGKRKIDEWKISAPIFGKVMRLNLFGQFARTLSTLLQNGVPVLTALEITEQIIPNRVLKEAIAETRRQVTDGKTIAQPMARSKVFPQLMVDLVKIGEETGNVPGSLANIAETYESELNVALRVVTNMIEPVIICVMALGVGFLLVSVLSAMFAITSSIGMK
jgi:general secretion pathway protein F